MGTPVSALPEHVLKQARAKWAVEDERRAALLEQAVVATVVKPKRAKYGNTRTAYRSDQGFERVYDSKAEAAYAMMLDRGRVSGLVLWWLPQVAVPLTGGVIYRMDFLVQWTDRLAFVDVKGTDTQASINKRKQVKACFGIEVEVVR